MASRPDYQKLAAFCDQQSKLSTQVLDEFLVYYAARMDGYDVEFDRRLKPFDPLSAELDPALLRRFKAQYVLHRVFKSGGPIRK